MSEFAAKRGDLIECTDEAILQYIMFLNEQKSPENRFIIGTFPPRHLFVKQGYVEEMKKAINEMVSRNTFSEEDRDLKRRGKAKKF